MVSSRISQPTLNQPFTAHQALALFEQAGHPAKVLCVALDYAKAQHTVLICNGLGDLLKATFVVDNTPTGAKLLLQEVRHCAKQRKIGPMQIFFGGEDYPSFAENFLRHLRQEKFLVLRVNAWEAKQQRSNFQASSDALDLLGIARCCLNRRWEPVRICLSPTPTCASPRATATNWCARPPPRPIAFTPMWTGSFRAFCRLSRAG